MVVLSKGKVINLVSLKFTPGDLWIAGAMISWAIYSIYLMNFKSNFDLVTRFALMIFFGILCMIPLSIVENFYFSPVSFDFNFFKYTLMAAILPGIIAFLMYAKLQTLVGASMTGLTVYLIPVYASFYGYLFFDEELFFYHWLGGLLVISGIIIANKNLFKSL
jgi:drug/metabolite transporter (DMT)-like permease